MLLILIVLIVLTLYLTKKLNKNINPAWFFVVYWIANIVLSRLFFINYDWNYFGLIWILLSCIFFVLGYYLVNRFVNVKEVKEEVVKTNQDLFTLIFLAVNILFALVYVLILIRNLGYNLTALLNIHKLLEMNAKAAELRYTDVESKSLFTQLLLIFVYSSTMIGGYYFSYAKNKYMKLLCVATIFPALLVMVVENTKATFIGGTIFWICSWLIGYMQKHKGTIKLKVKNLLLVCGIFFGLGMILFVSLMLRRGSLSSSDLVDNFYKIINYGFGHMAAFDYWYSSLRGDSLEFGKYTFYGIFNFLGIAYRMNGVYLEYLKSGIIDTNVFTANRGLISDFSTFGGLVFYGVLGALSAFSYKKIITNDHKNEIVLTILLVILSFICYSFIISIFTYLSFTLAYGVFFIFLILLNRRNSILNLFKKGK